MITYLIIAYVTLVHYLAIMHLKEARDENRLPEKFKPVAYVILFIGYIFDVLFQLVSTVPFLEFPKEVLYTGRVTRHLKANDQSTRLSRWRFKLSYISCRYFLDPFQKGGHCR